MSKSDRKQSLVMQAGIFAAAGIVVRIIGLLYNTPLVHIIGDEGFGYYDSAYAAYSIILMISSFSIPSAVSKIMAQKLANEEYNNAYRLFKCTLIYVTIVGLIAGFFVFFGAGILVKMESAILPLKVLAPTVFLCGLLGAFRGFFQARHSMVQTSLSQILEQIFNAGFSVLMAYVLVNSAKGLDSSTVASYGAAGSTIGTGVGVLTALIFMLIIYFYNRKSFMAKVYADRHQEDSYAKIFKMILMVVTPFILSTCVYNINTFMDKTIYQWVLMDGKGVVEKNVALDLSAYAKANKIANIPIALSAAMAATLIPRLSTYITKRQYDVARGQVEKAIRVTMFVSIPAAVLVGVLARPIMRVIFPQKESLALAANMLIVLALTVVLYALSTITQAVLQAIGKLNLPIINGLVSLILHAVLMILLMYILPVDWALYCYGFATVIYALILCVMNGIAVKKYLKYQQEVDKTFLRPIISSILMGAIAFGIYELLYYLTDLNFISLVVSLFVALITYLVLVIRWQAISEEELLSIPKGTKVVALAKKFKVMK
ncbi:MAG: polysaccharide biosynthesis protein [Lachnospiraceae bacterium]|nr:polysaccharide biosynthesis protein [Lachnospiraceae bacterium]